LSRLLTTAANTGQWRQLGAFPSFFAAGHFVGLTPVSFAAKKEYL